ncbi:MAG: ABC transporter substrate-binding protein [Faecousia sp.]
MKKLIALLLAAVMVLSLAACGGSSAPAATQAPATDTSTDSGKVDVASMTSVEKAAAEAEIRLALNMMIDRNYIIENIAQGGQTPATSFVPMGMTDVAGGQFYENAGDPTDGFAGYWDPSAEAYEDNYAKAYEILTKYYDVDENGMLVNFPTLTYLYNTMESHKAVGEHLQSVLAGVGINLQLENQEWNTFQNTRKAGDFSFARHGWFADYNDPVGMLDLWMSDSGNNDAQLGKGAHADLAVYSIDLTKWGYDIVVENGTWAETFDVLIDTIKTCTDEPVRFEMMHYAEDMLMGTGAIVPLYYYTDSYIQDKTVEGVGVNPFGYKYFMHSTVNGAGDSISVQIGSEPDTVDPALNSSVDGAVMIQHLFSGLAKWAPDENGSYTKIVADCAEELVDPVENEDGTVTYTYTLKPGQTWSDGKALTAADFVYGWNRSASEELGASYAYMMDYIKRNEDGTLAVTAIDDVTLEVTLNNATSFWNELLAFSTYMPVREDVVGDEGWCTEAATYVSNGAYTMTGWEHDSVITVQKRPEYHGAADVTMNEIKFFLSDDDNNILTNWKNDTWLFVESCPTNEIPAVMAEYPDEYHIVPSTGTYFLLFNMNEPLLP